jgi:hypothetical protein
MAAAGSGELLEDILKDRSIYYQNRNTGGFPERDCT